MNRKKVYLTMVCFAVLFMIGFEAGGFQISLLKIMEEAGVAASLSGVLVSGQYGAIIIMPLLFGGIADRRGKKKFLALFCLVFAAGCMAMSAMRPFAALFATAFIIGTGYSVSESLASALLSDVHGEQAGKYLNLSQCFFALGAMVSPQILEYGRTYLGWGYQSLFLICAGFGVLTAILAGIGARGEKPMAQTQEKSGEKIGREILYLMAGMFVYCCMDSGISYYIDAFVSLELGAAEHAANILSLFWFFMIAGRLTGGLLYRYRRQMLNLCLLLTGGSLILLMGFPSLTLAYICFSVAGFFLAPIWSNLMSLATERYPNNLAAATGMMSTGAGTGAVLAPLFLGMLVDGAGLRVGYCCIGVLAILGLVICQMYYRKIEEAV